MTAPTSLSSEATYGNTCTTLDLRLVSLLHLSSRL